MTSTNIRAALIRCLLVVLLATTPAMAQSAAPLRERGVMVWGSIGFQGDFGGSVNSSGIGTLNGRRAELDANTWGERYDPGFILRFGGAYNLTEYSQITGTIGWEQAEADEADAGLLAGVPIEVTFSDYQAWGFDVGYRRFLATEFNARPFVGAAIGFQNVDAITMNMRSTAGLLVNDLPFYDDSWVVQWRIGTGLLWDINDRFGAQVTVDLKYSGVLSDQSGIGSLGFERINDQGNRFTFPVLVGAFVKF
jgi:hypothetical protein